MQEIQECTTLQPVCNTVYQTVCTDSAGYSGKIKRDDSDSVRLSGKIKEDSGQSDRTKRDNVPFTAFSSVPPTGHHDDLTAPVSSASALYSVPDTGYGSQSCQQVFLSS